MRPSPVHGDARPARSARCSSTAGPGRRRGRHRSRRSAPRRRRTLVRPTAPSPSATDRQDRGGDGPSRHLSALSVLVGPGGRGRRHGRRRSRRRPSTSRRARRRPAVPPARASRPRRRRHHRAARRRSPAPASPISDAARRRGRERRRRPATRATRGGGSSGGTTVRCAVPGGRHASSRASPPKLTIAGGIADGRAHRADDRGRGRRGNGHRLPSSAPTAARRSGRSRSASTTASSVEITGGLDEGDMILRVRARRRRPTAGRRLRRPDRRRRSTADAADPARGRHDARSSSPTTPSPCDILRGVDLEVEAGDHVSIVGRSG